MDSIIKSPLVLSELLAFCVLVIRVWGVGRASRACRLMALLIVGWGGLGETRCEGTQC